MPAPFMGEALGRWQASARTASRRQPRWYSRLTAKRSSLAGADGTALLWDLSLEARAPASRPCPHLTDQEIEARWTALALRQSPETGNEDTYARIDALAEGGDRTVEF